MNIPRNEIMLMPYPEEGKLLRLQPPSGRYKRYDLRVWYLSATDEWEPTRYGISFRNKEQIAKLITRLKAAIAPDKDKATP